MNDLQLKYKRLSDEVRQKENEIREIEFEIQQAIRDKEKTGTIMDQYTARQSALISELDKLNDGLTNLRESTAIAVLSFEEKNKHFSHLQSKISETDGLLTQVRRELISVGQAESHLEAKSQAAREKQQELSDELKESKESLVELRSMYDQFKANRVTISNKLEGNLQLQLEIMEDVDNFQENYTQLESAFEKKQSEYALFKEQLNEVSARLYGLEDLHSSFEGFQEGVKSVMLWQRQKKEQMHEDGSVSVDFQPLAELVEVPEEYELAMEAGLGSKLQLLLSDSHSDSVSAVNYLKENQSGRSSFFTSDSSEPFDMVNSDSHSR